MGINEMDPPLFKRRVKERRGGFALELPLACHPDVLLMIHACPPHGPVALAERAGHEQIPLCPGRVALHVNLPVEAVMDRKGKELRGTTEELSDGVPAFKPSQALAFPHRVLGEERRNALWVVLVIAVGGIPRLEVPDGIDVFQGLHPLFQLGQAGHIAVVVHRHVVPPP